MAIVRNPLPLLPPRATRLIITCEHGGNDVPARYRALFAAGAEVLETHRGYDPGALTLARDFARSLHAPLVHSTTSRLLIELNRSPRHRQLFSEFSRGLGHDERERVLERYYRPYRSRVGALVADAIAHRLDALHVSSHSFTPELHGEVRRADVGLLYDPARRAERDLCRAWQDAIRRADAGLTVRRNYPYRGTADGLTTYLRTLHADPRYAGIEIEINQKHTLGEPRAWRVLRALLVRTLAQAVSATRGGRAALKYDS